MALRHRYLFIGGLHRSGTSLVARLAAGIDGVDAIRNAPVPENEGAYLQGGIPHDATHGRPGHFATDPMQHMTERHGLNTLATRERIEADWANWYCGNMPWRVEKSPVNLVRMRLLQQLFPLSQFIVVLRHPEAVAGAMAKWGLDVDATQKYWIAAHEIVDRDLPHLHAVMMLRYEDLTQNPQAATARIAAFLGQTAPPDGRSEDVSNRNADYAGVPRLPEPLYSIAARWGYLPGLAVDPAWDMPVRHPLREIRNAVACADES